MVQQNLFMNPPIMNINPMIQNDFNQLSNNDLNNPKINVRFFHQSGFSINIVCEQNTKIFDLIKEYRRRTNDFNENIFIFNSKKIDPSSSSTIKDIISMGGITFSQIEITVYMVGALRSKKSKN